MRSIRLFVEFGGFARGLEFDLLAEFAGKILTTRGKAGEDEGDRQHADRHHRFLQIPGVAFELGQAGNQAPGAASCICTAVCRSMAWVMTSSPTRLMSWSTFRR